MKDRLTAVDVFFLVRELDEKLKNSRVDKIYQLSKQELKLRFHVSGEGTQELIIAPNYLCLTNYPREVPTRATSFAMQLRKNLSGAFLRGIKQHEFDRIVIFDIEGKYEKYELIVEVFGDGNVFLCRDGKIAGLLNWQKWKDRTLGVGQEYVYPPAAKNPLKESFEDFARDIKKSEKNAASTIATDVGVGGIYAEAICMEAGVENKKSAAELSDSEITRLFKSFKNLLEKLTHPTPEIVVKDGIEQDVLPIGILPYKDCERIPFETFNEAVDEFFSKKDMVRESGKEKTSFKKDLAKLENVLEKQEETIRGLEEKSGQYHEAGDAIYRHYNDIESLLSAIRCGRKKGLSDTEISKKLEEAKRNGVAGAALFGGLKGNDVVVETDKTN
ncbi:MAG: hypothetical protein MSIBF_06615 [Candidatus Altiarchaeales archaeon IMC4]|nr:MAG: hypothetical protein MSIBF_06615 [Candidatus Altiarchaeales archaeon IMC4]